MMQRTKAQLSYLKSGESIVGGLMALYLSTNMIRFDDHTKFKPTEGFCINGNLVDLTLVKSRTARAGSSVTLVFDQENGFDEQLSLFILLKNAGKINGAGVGLYLSDRNDMKFSQKTFKSKLAENEELQQLFMSEVSAVLKEMIHVDEVKAKSETKLKQSVSTGILSMLNTPMSV